MSICSVQNGTIKGTSITVILKFLLIIKYCYDKSSGEIIIQKSFYFIFIYLCCCNRKSVIIKLQQFSQSGKYASI